MSSSSSQLPVPKALLHSLKGVPGFDEAAFLNVHASGKQMVSIRTNPAKPVILEFNGISTSPVPWSGAGYYLSDRPSFTFDPLLHAGAYYVQEASSMFLEQALLQLADLSQSLTVLDLCAAPGGKSTHIQSLISGNSVLVSNELIRPRVNILLENITKWGAGNCIVTNNDPADFGKIPGLFDIIVVDAPCSGSGLFRKDPAAIEEWSEANVLMCSYRQQKILADVWPVLKPGGLLVYSTCSYSVEEDESMADFILETFDAVNHRLDIQPEWGIVETQSAIHKGYGYRFYPNKAEGEGFYLSCFRKEMNDFDKPSFKANKYKVDKKITTLAAQWIGVNEAIFLHQHQEQLFAIPADCYDLFLNLQKPLNVRKAGIKLGDTARNELIPDHALALSTVYSDEIARIDLNKEQAIAFLRKEMFEIDLQTKGWMMCCYEGFGLGWIKSLGNRFNNYYPKEWRIRK